MSPITRAALVLLASLAALGTGTTDAAADPFYCAVVTDQQGRPVYTVCVPGVG